MDWSRETADDWSLGEMDIGERGEREREAVERGGWRESARDGERETADWNPGEMEGWRLELRIWTAEDWSSREMDD